MNNLTQKSETNPVHKNLSNIKPAGANHWAIEMIKDLCQGKKTEDDNLFIIEGLWAFEKLMKSEMRLKAFVFCPDFIQNAVMEGMVLSLISISENVYTISRKLCEKLSRRDRPEGFFIVPALPRLELNQIKLSQNNLIVILDGLEKPGNIGTIIRSVDGAGGDAVILCNNKVRMTHQKLIKGSMGSCFLIPVIETDMESLFQWLRENDFKVILTDLQAEKCYLHADYSGRVAIVAGNEIHGISQYWNSYECERVIIPMFGGADSLNVGFAATMVAYQASLKQKGFHTL